MFNRRTLKLAFGLTLAALTVWGLVSLTQAAQDGFGTRNGKLAEAIEAGK